MFVRTNRLKFVPASEITPGKLFAYKIDSSYELSIATTDISPDENRVISVIFRHDQPCIIGVPLDERIIIYDVDLEFSVKSLNPSEILDSNYRTAKAGQVILDKRGVCVVLANPNHGTIGFDLETFELRKIETPYTIHVSWKLNSLRGEKPAVEVVRYPSEESVT